LASLTGSANLQPPEILVEWVQVAETIPTTNQCIYTSDVGNIKVETDTVCSFDEDGASYNVLLPPTKDPSTPQPACSDGAEYTACIYINASIGWACQDYLGNEEVVDEYFECQLKD